MARVQAVAGMEFDEVRHRRADIVSAARPRMLSHVHIGFDDAPVSIHVIAVKTRAVVLVFADHPELPCRRSVTLAPGGNTRLRYQFLPPVQIRPLRAQAHADGSLPA